ncbi:hypothetical protein SDC9_189835 [bioreactor metagenome]|uniref:Uncharacterized protein n=1 Tax=bioreactor metagenome TaxID=1076179 RepID=A0A645HTA1_9ZZZZ
MLAAKGVAQPAQAAVVDQHAVEAAGAFAVAGQPVAGGEDDALLLEGVDAGAGVAEIAAAAGAHLDEDDGGPVLHDEVDFAAAHPEVAFAQAQAAPRQVGRRFALGFAAAGDGGIVGFCLHRRK